MKLGGLVDSTLVSGGMHLPREILLTRVAIAFTLVVSSLLTAEIVGIAFMGYREADYWQVTEQTVFFGIVAFLIYGNLVYQFTRIGYLRRLMGHRPAPRDDIERVYDEPAPLLTILVPSYKEETQVVRQTILSAALQEYPERRVVLLIDDPPSPGNPDDLAGLAAARRLSLEVQRLLDEPAAKLGSALESYLERKIVRISASEEYRKLASLYYEVAAWFRQQASACPVRDHTDRWFVEKVLLDPARTHEERAAELEHRAAQEGRDDEDRITREYHRLASLFRVTLSSFERKRYENLSHEPNKAMNLNSYIGLIGQSLREFSMNGRLHLERTKPEKADFSVPAAKYLITLDADSLLLQDYALRLIHIMEQPGNEKLAVAQTPYNAIPNPEGVLERIAGATTDIQYIIHQGFTSYDATYWVGANALLRMESLEDIMTMVEERGFRVTQYIQDRTVIEDTESSIDLVDRNWRLYNYPERLAFSATPSDFGALLIQRRRWANGGLIIFPKLVRYLLKPWSLKRKVGEGLLRSHYLTSITGVNIGLVIILLYPFEDNLRSAWLPLSALPYYFFYGRDLLHSGYRIGDLFRVYALNLLLVPVNLGGVFKSIHQAWTGQEIPFKRTPKVMGRTAAPAMYVVLEALFLLYCGSGFVVDSVNGRWMHAAFALVNGGFFLYAIKTFIGLRNGMEDIEREWAVSRPRQVLLSLSRSFSDSRILDWLKSNVYFFILMIVFYIML